MLEYRIYYVGRDGRFSSAESIDCADDQEAIHKAKQAVNGQGIELWEHSRFITRIQQLPQATA
jgi:hypothetical protein